ncbi:isopeptide-forming domain-containing fimbrial protein [Periweissella cryptocerci]|uniref:Isopeptide-forming domain-containing fimbrial protein n=1 Tax=Periweissella cryptocerci TaxID=2506420 RepID=A0A4P6YQU0_9LACO|nr:SpaA isopeptide-forming pilin-related protein [Periweissella cryptocerci]QBO34971.1 isopeptide-forming domain-containing fimbrial protein [Periweissella cryptocerci]
MGNHKNKKKWVRKLQRAMVASAIATSVAGTAVVATTYLSPNILNVKAAADISGVDSTTWGKLGATKLSKNDKVELENQPFHISALNITSVKIENDVGTSYNATTYQSAVAGAMEQNQPSLAFKLGNSANTESELPSVRYAINQKDDDGDKVDVILSITGAKHNSSFNGGIIAFNKESIGYTTTGYDDTTYSYKIVKHGTNDSANLGDKQVWISFNDIDANQGVGLSSKTAANVDGMYILDADGGIKAGVDSNGNPYALAGIDYDEGVENTENNWLVIFKPGTSTIAGHFAKSYTTYDRGKPYDAATIKTQQDIIDGAPGNKRTGQEYLGFTAASAWAISEKPQPFTAPYKNVTDDDEDEVKNNTLPNVNEKQHYDIANDVPENPKLLDSYRLQDTIDPMWNVTDARVYVSHKGNHDDDSPFRGDDGASSGNQMFDAATIKKNADGSTSVSASALSDILNGKSGLGFADRTYTLRVYVTPNTDYILAHMGDKGETYRHSGYTDVASSGASYKSGNNVQVYNQGSLYLNYDGAADGDTNSDDSSGNLQTKYTGTTKTLIPLINVKVSKQGLSFEDNSTVRKEPNSAYDLSAAKYALYKAADDGTDNAHGGTSTDYALGKKLGEAQLGSDNTYTFTGIPAGVRMDLVETASGKGYNIPAAQSAGDWGTLIAKGDTNAIAAGGTYTETVQDKEQYGYVEVDKSGVDFGTNMPSSFYALTGTMFQLYQKGSMIKVGVPFAVDALGKSTSQKIALGDYDIREVSTDHGYILNKDWVGSASVKASFDSANPTAQNVGTTKVAEKNQEQYGSFSFQKYDRDKDATSPAGAGSLDGAQYTITRLYDGKTWTATTHDGGKITSKDLGAFNSSHFQIADYSIKETKASIGYLVDSTATNFSVKYAGQDAKVAADVPVKDSEQIIRNNVTIHKDADSSKALVAGQTAIAGLDEDYSNKSLQQPLKGIEFKATLTDGTGYNKKDGVATKIPADGNVFYSDLSDDNGNAVFHDLPYGHYTITEEKTKQDGTQNFPDGLKAIQPLHIKVTEDAKNGVIDNDGKSTRPKGYTFDEDDDQISWPIKVTKVDSETGKVIPFADTQFKIKDLVTGKYLEMNVPNKTDKTDIFKTNDEGYFFTTDSLDFGVNRYQLEEVHAPNGYVLASQPMTISVDKQDDTGKQYMEFNFPDENQKGKLTVSKIVQTMQGIGEQKSDLGKYMGLTYDKRPGEGYQFMLKATKDVVTPDGTVRVKEGQYIDAKGLGTDDKAKALVMTTDKDGKTTTGDAILYIGSYELDETKAPAGVTVAKPYNFDVTYAGETVKATSYDTTVNDQLQLLNIIGHKSEQVLKGYKDNQPQIDIQDAQDGQVFALRNADDFKILDADVKADTTLALAKVKNGKFEFDTYLPEGKYYAQEVDAGNSHVLNKNKYYFTYKAKNNDDTQGIQIYSNGAQQDKGSESDDDAAADSEDADADSDKVVSTTEIANTDVNFDEKDAAKDGEFKPENIMNNLFLADVPFEKDNQVIGDDLYAGTDKYVPATGAEFELKDAQGKVIQTISTVNGKGTWSKLAVGVYSMKETKASDLTHALNPTEYVITVAKDKTTIVADGKTVGTIDNTKLEKAYEDEQLPKVTKAVADNAVLTDAAIKTAVDGVDTDSEASVDTTSDKAADEKDTTPTDKADSEVNDDVKVDEAETSVADALAVESAFTVKDPVLPNMPKPGVEKYIDTQAGHVKDDKDDVDQTVKFVIPGQLPLLDAAKDLTKVSLKDTLEEGFTYKAVKIIDVTAGNKDITKAGRLVTPKTGSFGGLVQWFANDSASLNDHKLEMHLDVAVNSKALSKKYYDKNTDEYVVPNVAHLLFNGFDLNSDAKTRTTTTPDTDLPTPPVHVLVKKPGVDKNIVGKNNKLLKDEAVKNSATVPYVIDAYYPYSHNMRNVTIYDKVVDALIPEKIVKVVSVDAKGKETDVTKQWKLSIEKKEAGLVKAAAKNSSAWSGAHVRLYFTAKLGAHSTDKKYWDAKKQEFVIPNAGHMTYDDKDLDSNAKTRTPGKPGAPTDLVTPNVTVHFKQPKASVEKYWVTGGKKSKELNAKLGSVEKALIIGHVPSVSDLKNLQITDPFEDAFTPTGKYKVTVDGKDVTKQFTPSIQQKAGGLAVVKAKNSQKWAGKDIYVYFDAKVNSNYTAKKYRDKDGKGYTIPNVGHLKFNSQDLRSDAKANADGKGNHDLLSNKVVVHLTDKQPIPGGRKLSNTGFMATTSMTLLLISAVMMAGAGYIGFKLYKERKI